MPDARPEPASVLPTPALWTPASWQSRPVLQQPAYPDAAKLDDVLGRLATLPPLVTSWEIERLKTHLAEAAHGKRFVLQGGDCAERFEDCHADAIARRLKILLQMSLVLVYGMRVPVVRVGRFAGQYAKPRSADLETRNGRSLPSYRGDIVNKPDWDAAAREPDPERMLKAYAVSAMTLNFVRALSAGGFADLHHPEYWDLDFVQHSPSADDYHALVEAIRDSVRFMETVTSMPLQSVEAVEFFTSHEALLLPYEQALTRRVPRREPHYNLGTHFPWIGKRTADPGGAHVEYARGIANPIAVKVGPDTSASTLRDLIGRLDPHAEPGRLTLVTRMGADAIERGLPPLVDAVRAMGRTPLWVCDPMHGNTETTATGRKTRRFENILSELEAAFAIHAAHGSRLGGVHFELTGDDVTECTGGARGLADADLEHAYRSRVDPRLNAEQALEMAFCIQRARRG